MFELLQFVPILVEGYNPITGTLSIDIVGVGSKYDWLEIFQTIVAVIIAFLTVLGLETLIRIFRRKK